MIAESLAARRPVIALRPERVRFGLATEEITTMACGGGLSVLPIRSVDGCQFAEALMALRPADGNPLDVIAAAIRHALQKSVGFRREAARSLPDPA